MISVPKVEVSQDLKNADIFLSFYNEDKKNEPQHYFNEFSKYKKSIKYKLGLSLKLKYMPKINFVLADDYEYYDKIDRLLKNDK
mgnify:CR=1 FL=1